MDNFINNIDLPFMSNFQNIFNNASSNNCLNDLDLNKLLVILLLLTGNLTIEALTVYPSDFAVTLGTFKIR